MTPDGGTTSDAELALKDERTGAVVESPDHALWLQSTALQTALMQAYLSSRLAALTMALGGALLATGLGLAAAGSHRKPSPVARAASLGRSGGLPVS